MSDTPTPDVAELRRLAAKCDQLGEVYHESSMSTYREALSWMGDAQAALAAAADRLEAADGLAAFHEKAIAKYKARAEAAERRAEELGRLLILIASEPSVAQYADAAPCQCKCTHFRCAVAHAVTAVRAGVAAQPTPPAAKGGGAS